MAEKGAAALDKLKNIWKAGKLKKDNFLILILAGVLLLVISWPVSDSSKNQQNTKNNNESVLLDDNNGIMNLPEYTETYTGSSENPDYRQDGGLEAYTAYLERKLEEVLSVMEGAGKVKVMITLSSSGEAVLEKDTVSNRSGVTEVDAEGGSRNTSDISSEQASIFVSDSNGNSYPYVKKTLQPEIAGVVVAVQGGGNAKIIQNITEAIVALFDVDEHKIKIVKMIS